MIKFIRGSLVVGAVCLFCLNLGAVQPVDFCVDPKTNDIKIKMTAFGTGNGDQQTKDVLLDSEIYREILDEDGNPCWIKDDSTYSYSSYIAYSVSQEKPYITISWIGNDPVTPSKRFKIILKERNSNGGGSQRIILQKIFEVEKPNI